VVLRLPPLGALVLVTEDATPDPGATPALPR
jgi:hypothetical protein